MAHQLGLDAQADARWIALTQMIERGAGWLDQVLQRWPTPDLILGESDINRVLDSGVNSGVHNGPARMGSFTAGDRQRVSQSTAALPAKIVPTVSCDDTRSPLSAAVG